VTITDAEPALDWTQLGRAFSASFAEFDADNLLHRDEPRYLEQKAA
jgi:hypothetical protein